MTEHWHILQVRQDGELKVAEELRRLDYQVLVPLRWIKRQHRRTKAWRRKQVPVLPGYLLLAEGVKDWRGVFAVDGVSGLVEGANGGDTFYPATIPQSAIEHLLNEELEDEALPQLLLALGTEVRMTEGPFVGYNGLVTGIEREKITVELSYRCKKLPIKVNASLLMESKGNEGNKHLREQPRK